MIRKREMTIPNSTVRGIPDKELKARGFYSVATREVSFMSLRISDRIYIHIDYHGFATLVRSYQKNPDAPVEYHKVTIPRPVRSTETLDTLLSVLCINREPLANH